MNGQSGGTGAADTIRFADRVALLAETRLVAAGSPVEVLTPARLAEVYGVEAAVLPDAAGCPAMRSMKMP